MTLIQNVAPNIGNASGVSASRTAIAMALSDANAGRCHRVAPANRPWGRTSSTMLITASEDDARGGRVGDAR